MRKNIISCRCYASHSKIVRATNMQSIMEKIKKRRKNSMRKIENAKSNYQRRSA
jgi:hypothetical protein